MLTAFAITAGIAVTVVVLLILRLMGRPCLVCDKPVIDCLCPLEIETDEVDSDFTRTFAAGYVQLPDWGPAPVYPRHPEIPKEGS